MYQYVYFRCFFVLSKYCVFLQFDNYYVSIRISYVFADVYMCFHPTDTSGLDVNFLLPAIWKCQTPLERRLRIHYVVRVGVL